uniref:Endophilin-B2 n=1 Tax=Anthurium amnicola TaxID=1678845 RepID=A0A1D1YBT0_9ARAE
MLKHRLLHPRRTNPLFWLAAALCALLALAVIVAAAAVLSVYIASRPKLPYLRVAAARLDRLGYAQRSGLLDVLMAVDLEAANRNARAAASFSGADFDLLFAGAPVARLRAAAFAVPANSTLPLHYLVESSGAALGGGGVEKVEEGVRKGRVEFELKGKARMRWKVGGILTAKLWSHLHCRLQFLLPQGSTIGLDCTSKPH